MRQMSFFNIFFNEKIKYVKFLTEQNRNHDSPHIINIDLRLVDQVGETI